LSHFFVRPKRYLNSTPVSVWRLSGRVSMSRTGVITLYTLGKRSIINGMAAFTEVYKLSPFDQLTLSREEGRIYSADFATGQGKYISKVFASDEEPFDISIKVSPKIEVRLTYIYNDKDINGIRISKVGGRNKSESVTLSSYDSKMLIETLQLFSSIDLGAVARESVLLDAQIVKDPVALEKFLRTIAADSKGSDIMTKVAENLPNLTPSYIQEMSRRRKNVECMRKMLEDRSEFDAVKAKLAVGKDEEVWQRFFQKNDWILGSDVIELLDVRALSERDITDLPFKGVDGFLDIIELKLPDVEMWTEKNVPRSVVTGAIMQCARYLRTTEIKANDHAKMKELGVEIIKPRITLICGRSNNWSDEQREQLRILNSSLHDISILTYDYVLKRAEKLIEVEEV